MMSATFLHGASRRKVDWARMAWLSNNSSVMLAK
jgi:hypothetical protein